MSKAVPPSAADGTPTSGDHRDRDPLTRDGSSPRGVLLAASAFCAILLIALLGVLHVPYVALGPGPVTDVIAAAVPASPSPTADARPSGGTAGGGGLITISGTDTYPTDGQLDLTTVSLRGGPGLEMTLWEALADWRDPDVSVVPRSLYFRSGTSQEQADAESAAEMTGSQENAKVAALTELGITFKATTTRRVQQIGSDAPAARVLRVGDEITSVNGVEVADFAALQNAVRALPPGTSVQLGLERSGKPRTVTTATYAPQGTTLLGIVPDVEYAFPFDIDIAIDDVGGPSAGTMFALGIVDELTPGAMTGGRHIAGTGEIAADGTVGPIGGLRQKVIGARADGATWFLAPVEECAQVAGATPDGITVVGISTLHGARMAVEAIGAGRGAELTTCDETATVR
ncbi:MAG: YlbL family protein [Janthinobacterium lividum]